MSHGLKVQQLRFEPVSTACARAAIARSPWAREMKERGQLIGDRVVVEVGGRGGPAAAPPDSGHPPPPPPPPPPPQALLTEMMNPKYASGMIVDGFPRTVVQAECIKLIHDRILTLRREHSKDATLLRRFRRPVFHIAVLYVNEEVSVARQVREAGGGYDPPPTPAPTPADLAG